MTTESKRSDTQEKLAQLREEVARLERSLNPDSAGRSGSDKDLRLAIMFGVIYEHSPDPSAIISLEGTLRHANRPACETLGITASESTHRPFWEMAWWAHSAAERENLRNGLRRASLGELVRFESACPAADGMMRHMEFTIRPARDEAGRPLCLILEARDISERRRAEEENKSSESRLRSVFRATPMAETATRNESPVHIRIRRRCDRSSGCSG